MIIVYCLLLLITAITIYAFLNDPFVIVTHYVSVRPVGGSLNGKAAKVYWVSCGFEPRPLKTIISGRAKKRSDLTS